MKDNIRDVVSSYVELRGNIKKVEDKVKEAKKKLEEYKAIIINHLEENQQTTIGYDDLGSVTISTTDMYSYPKDVSKIKEFNSWIVKTRGTEYMRLNYTLSKANINKCIEEEKLKIADPAKKASFLPPGIDIPFGIVKLSYKKPKSKLKKSIR